MSRLWAVKVTPVRGKNYWANMSLGSWPPCYADNRKANADEEAFQLNDIGADDYNGDRPPYRKIKSAEVVEVQIMGVEK